MSGPVANGLAQLDDALLELGLDREVLVSALVTELHSLDAADLRLNPHVPQKRQRVWDHIAALWPTWRVITIGADYELALREERRLGPVFSQMVIDEMSELPSFERITAGSALPTVAYRSYAESGSMFTREGNFTASRRVFDARGMEAVEEDALYEHLWRYRATLERYRDHPEARPYLRR